ncbi:AAA family ATPase [Agathobacter sp.]
MGRFVNPGNSAFKVAVDSEIYIDKTGILEFTNSVLGTKQAYICNSRPRRFGKSVTADMLTAYYSRGCDSKTLFADYTIAHSEDFEKYLNKYDVIHLDMQWILMDSGDPGKISEYINKNVISELADLYNDIDLSEQSTLYGALSVINNETNNKFIIIIDEWDVLIRDEAANASAQEGYINLLRGLFKGSEPTKYIELAFLTGILPIKKLKTQSALNNFDEYTMLYAGRLSPYIGFTEDEVRAICERYGRDFVQVEHWYDGYMLGNYHVYNPRAVVNYMLQGDLKSYWSETGSYEVIVPLINLDFDGLKTAILEMLSGGEIKVNTGSFKNDIVSFKNKDDVLTYLIHLGYLGFDQKRSCAFIPNEEIRQELTTAVDSTKWSELITFENESMELLNATLDMENDMVASMIGRIHDEYASGIQYNNENSLSSVLTIAYLSAMNYYFKPVRELPTGRGFADFVYIPKPEYVSTYPALVVELKWNKTVVTALDQIKEKQYTKSIEQYTGDILLVGISYDKKTKKHQCIIEKYMK